MHLLSREAWYKVIKMALKEDIKGFDTLQFYEGLEVSKELNLKKNCSLNFVTE